MSLQEISFPEVSSQIAKRPSRPKKYPRHLVLANLCPGIWYTAPEAFAMLDEVFPDMEFYHLSPRLSQWAKVGKHVVSRVKDISFMFDRRCARIEYCVRETGSHRANRHKKLRFIDLRVQGHKL